MPNWCACSVTFDCSDELFDEICSYVKSEEDIFDFNRIIPMPESLNIEASFHSDRAAAYFVTERLTIPVEQTDLSNLISNSLSEDWAHEVVSSLTTWAETASDEDKDKLYEMGKQYMFNKENYGAFHWYDWSIENWGTKWNAAEVSLHEKNFKFDTAWSPCSPVIKTLSKLFPDAHIRFQYSEPGWGFCGVEEYWGGYKIYQLEGDYYEIWPEDNEDGTRTNIDEDKLPLSDKTIDYYLDEKECGLLVKTGKLYYREKIDDEYIVEIVADVIFADKLPENIWE